MSHSQIEKVPGKAQITKKDVETGFRVLEHLHRALGELVNIGKELGYLGKDK